MNHDYAHCSDYDVDCPKECFRAQLTKELQDNPTVVPYGIASWMSFKDTDECHKMTYLKSFRTCENVDELFQKAELAMTFACVMHDLERLSRIQEAIDVVMKERGWR